MLQRGNRPSLVLACTGLLAWIPLVRSDDEFVRWHAKQGLVLFLLTALLAFVPFLGFVVMALWPVVALVTLILALRGRRARIPGVHWVCTRF
ncbi:MAG: hypothetical protein AMXMBFR34_17510 [Myxococcaceae bacterium]